MSLPFSKGKIKVFVSSVSLDKEVKLRQKRVVQCLETRGIEHTVADTAEGLRNKRELRILMMGKTAPPPQIFNGNDWCGDYESFDLAVEDEVLEQFLQLEKPKPKVEEKEGKKEEKNEISDKKEHLEDEVTNNEEKISVKNVSNIKKKPKSVHLERKDEIIKTSENKAEIETPEAINSINVSISKKESLNEKEEIEKKNIKIEIPQNDSDQIHRDENLNADSSRDDDISSDEKGASKDSTETQEDSSESSSSKETTPESDREHAQKKQAPSPIPPVPPPPPPLPPPPSSTSPSSQDVTIDHHQPTPIPFTANDLLKGKSSLKSNLTTPATRQSPSMLSSMSFADAPKKGVLKMSAGDLMRGRVALKSKYDQGMPRNSKLNSPGLKKEQICQEGDKKEIDKIKENAVERGDNDLEANKTSREIGKTRNRRNYLEKDPVPLLGLRNSLKSVKR